MKDNEPRPTSIFFSIRCKEKSQETGIERDVVIENPMTFKQWGAKKNPKKRELKDEYSYVDDDIVFCEGAKKNPKKRELKD